MTGLVEALVRSVHALQKQDPCWRGPVFLTEQQAEQLLYASGQQKPDDWDDLVAKRLVGSTVLGLPVELAATVEESTPYIEGWISA